jgi:hypothetical protein
MAVLLDDLEAWLLQISQCPRGSLFVRGWLRARFSFTIRRRNIYFFKSKIYLIFLFYFLFIAVKTMEELAGGGGAGGWWLSPYKDTTAKARD